VKHLVLEFFLLEFLHLVAAEAEAMAMVEVVLLEGNQAVQAVAVVIKPQEQHLYFLKVLLVVLEMAIVGLVVVVVLAQLVV
jgi:hypothetical protein